MVPAFPMSMRPMTQVNLIFSLVTSFKLSSSRKQKEILQDDSHMRDMWKEVCLRDNNEEALGDAHRRKAFLVQGVRQAVYAERKSQGECQTSHITQSESYIVMF